MKLALLVLIGLSSLSLVAGIKIYHCDEADLVNLLGMEEVDEYDDDEENCDEHHLCSFRNLTGVTNLRKVVYRYCLAEFVEDGVMQDCVGSVKPAQDCNSGDFAYVCFRICTWSEADAEEKAFQLQLGMSLIALDLKPNDTLTQMELVYVRS